MEVESEDEEDEREVRHDGHPSQPDQDTQVQDMDEVGRRHSNTTTQFLENMVYNAFLYFTRDLMRKRME